MHQLPEQIWLLIYSYMEASDIRGFNIIINNEQDNKQDQQTHNNSYKNKYMMSLEINNQVGFTDYYSYLNIKSMKYFLKNIGKITANIYSEVNLLKPSDTPNWSDSQRVQYFHQKEIFRIKVLKAAEEMTEGFLASRAAASDFQC